MKPEDGRSHEIGVKCCPKCRTPIIQTLRFSNEIKKAFKHIHIVKTKIFGQKSEIEKLLNQLSHIDLPNIKKLIHSSPPFGKFFMCYEILIFKLFMNFITKNTFR